MPLFERPPRQAQCDELPPCPHSRRTFPPGFQQPQQPTHRRSTPRRPASQLKSTPATPVPDRIAQVEQASLFGTFFPRSNDSEVGGIFLPAAKRQGHAEV